jgi:nicotinamidase-related amidase
MKKLTVLAVMLMVLLSSNTFAQEKKEQKPIKPALLVIDVQNAYLTYMDARDKEVGMYFVNILIELFRSHGYPVIRIYHHNVADGPHPGSDQFEYPSTVLVKPEDPKVIKTYPDGFNKTDLDKVIKETGSNTLFLCGLSSVGCVLATWIGAQNNDYKAFMVKDALISHNAQYTDNVEMMFDAVSYDVVKLIVEGTGK